MTYVEVDDVAIGDAFAEYARRFWWLNLVLGILAILFGAFVFSYKEATVFIFAVFLGAFLLGWGVFKTIDGFGQPSARWLYVAYGILVVGAGILTLAWPQITVRVLEIILGWFLVLWGTLDIIGAGMHTERDWWWLRLIRGIIVIGLGIWALAQPGVTTRILIAILAISAVVFGIVELVSAFRLRKFPELWEDAKAHGI